MFVAPGAVDCSVMQKSAGFLYFTLQMAWCGNTVALDEVEKVVY